MNQFLDDNSYVLTPSASNQIRLLQFTDCHIFENRRDRLLGLDTRNSFETVCGAAFADNSNIDLLLATGDLSQDGSADSYAYLAQRINDRALSTFWLAGNHDRQSVLRDHFCGAQIHATKKILVGGWVILMLDSTVQGEVYGRLSQFELDFLDTSLTLYHDRHALVCLHHQALDIGSEWLDQKGLKNADQLRHLLEQHDNVKGVLWGHVHQEAHFYRNGIQWLATPSTCVQFKPNSRDFAVTAEAPGYRRVDLHADGSIETSVQRVALTISTTA